MIQQQNENSLKGVKCLLCFSGQSVGLLITWPLRSSTDRATAPSLMSGLLDVSCEALFNFYLNYDYFYTLVSVTTFTSNKYAGFCPYSEKSLHGNLQLIFPNGPMIKLVDEC